jgi:O-antigen/teichoic acid export membrane protein
MLILLRKFIIFYLFSERYAPAVEIIVPLALAFGFAGFSKPFTLFLMARRHSKPVRNISVAVPLIHIALGIYIIPEYGISGAAWIAALVYLLDVILYVVSYNHVIKNTVQA